MIKSPTLTLFLLVTIKIAGMESNFTPDFCGKRRVEIDPIKGIAKRARYFQPLSLKDIVCNKLNETLINKFTHTATIAEIKLLGEVHDKQVLDKIPDELTHSILCNLLQSKKITNDKKNLFCSTILKENFSFSFKTALLSAMAINPEIISNIETIKGPWDYAISSCDLNFVQHLIKKNNPVQNPHQIFKSLSNLLQARNNSKKSEKILAAITQHFKCHLQKFISSEENGSHYIISKNPIPEHQFQAAVEDSFSLSHQLAISQDLMLEADFFPRKSLNAQIKSKKRLLFE